MAITLPVVGVAMGANVIEKHLTYDRSVKGEDFESALEPASLKRLVRAIRQSEQALGDPAWRPLSKVELDYRGVVRKRAVFARAVKAGETLAREMIAFKRADAGLAPDEVRAMVGRTVARDVAPDDPLDWSAVG